MGELLIECLFGLTNEQLHFAIKWQSIETNNWLPLQKKKKKD